MRTTKVRGEGRGTSRREHIPCLHLTASRKSPARGHAALLHAGVEKMSCVIVVGAGGRSQGEKAARVRAARHAARPTRDGRR
eukprot:1426625-Prymnesium_polylepis.1